MISQHLLDVLRCPLDPKVPLQLEGDRLVCTRCGVRFVIQDDFPKMIAEEAELPPGITELSRLPCQAARAETTPPA